MTVKRSAGSKSSSARAPARKPAAHAPVAKQRPAAKVTHAVARAAASPAKPARKAAVHAVSKPAVKPVAPRVKVAKVRSRYTLRDVVLDALADMKAVDVKALDVRGMTDITDTMVVASGTSDRHVKSIADRVVQRCKEAGFRPYGMEGERDGEWVLLDLQDVVLHVMLPRVREFYALEKLWEGSAAKRA
jgi:ribosome-associated protein